MSIDIVEIVDEAVDVTPNAPQEDMAVKFEGKTRLKIDKLVTCDAEIMSGTPVFKNTRVPIKNLIDYLEVGESLDEFLEDFPSVNREQAVQALELAKEVLLAHVYANSH